MSAEQPELPIPLELTKTSFYVEILRAARVNPTQELLDALETGRRNVLKPLATAASLKSRTFDLLHLFALAQILRGGGFYDTQRNMLTALLPEDPESGGFIERVSAWFYEATILLQALETIRRVDLGMFKDIINNV
jgi:hypothetical protein